MDSNKGQQDWENSGSVMYQSLYRNCKCVDTTVFVTTSSEMNHRGQNNQKCVHSSSVSHTAWGFWWDGWFNIWANFMFYSPNIDFSLSCRGKRRQLSPWSVSAMDVLQELTCGWRVASPYLLKMLPGKCSWNILSHSAIFCQTDNHLSQHA